MTSLAVRLERGERVVVAIGCEEGEVVTAGDDGATEIVTLESAETAGGCEEVGEVTSSGCLLGRLGLSHCSLLPREGVGFAPPLPLLLPERERRGTCGDDVISTALRCVGRRLVRISLLRESSVPTRPRTSVCSGRTKPDVFSLAPVAIAPSTLERGREYGR